MLRDKNLEVEELNQALQNRNDMEMDMQMNPGTNRNILNPELEMKIEALMNENEAMSELIASKSQEIESLKIEMEQRKIENGNLYELNSTLKKLNEEYLQKINSGSKASACKHHDYEENIAILKDYESKIETLLL